MIELSWNPTERQLKQFAFACLPGFTLIGWVLRRAWPNAWIAGAAVGAALLVLGLARPRSLRPLYVALMLIATPIGWVVSNVFVALIYYLVFTPIALFFRLIGRDALALRARDRQTHWVPHETSDDVRSYYRQG